MLDVSLKESSAFQLSGADARRAFVVPRCRRCRGIGGGGGDGVGRQRVKVFSIANISLIPSPILTNFTLFRQVLFLS